jgi:tetratricopeptide (TPR) repeat protein
LGSVNRREGNWAANMVHYNRAHDLDPNNNNLIRNMGSTYQMLRDWDKAVEVYNILSLIPSVSGRWKYYAARSHFFTEGSIDEGSRGFAQKDLSTELDRSHLEFLYLTSNLQSLREDEIINEWEDLASPGSLIAPVYTSIRHAMVLTALGELEKREAVLNSMIKSIEERAKTSNEDFVGQMALGLVHALKGNIEEAQTAIDLAVAIRPESSDAFRGNNLAAERAIILGWMGKKDEAVAELTRLAKKPGWLINYHAFKNSLSFLPLRDHPGFQKLREDPALKLSIPIQ